MKSIQKINVDISRDRNLSEPSVYAKQNDSNSREVEVTLCDNGVQLSSLTTTGKVFFGKGANAYAEAIEISNGVTEFTIPQNALSSPGRIQAEILILNADDDTETLTSASFAINCRTQINPSGSIDGENNGDYIEQIVDDLQSQIDNLGGADVSEFQSQLDTLQTNVNSLQMQVGPMYGDMNDWIGSDTVYQAVTKLKAKDTDLQSQIDTKIEQVNGRTGKSIAITANDIASVGSNTNLAMDVSLLGGEVDKINAHLGEHTSSKTIHELIDTKVTKVDGKGLSTNDYDDTAKEKVTKIGNTDLIPSDSRYIVQWIQDVYDSVFTSTADNTCLADRVTAEGASRQSADENLQSQIDALGGVDVSELQTDINHLQEKVNVMNGDIGDWIGSDTVYQAVTKLKAKDTDLQSQIDNLGGVDVSELETDIETLKTNVSNLQSADATAMDSIGRLMTADENLQSQIDTLESDIVDLQAQTLQQTPLFTDSIEECTDTSSLYVLPDGYIYAYMFKERSGTTANFTNQIPISTDTNGSIYDSDGYADGSYLSSSGGVSTRAGCVVSGFIPYTGDKPIYFKGTDLVSTSTYTRINLYNSSKTKVGNMTQTGKADNNVHLNYNFEIVAEGDYFKLTPKNLTSTFSGIAFIRISCEFGITGDEWIVTIDEPITYTVDEGGYSWRSTGHRFVPADYEDRIITLETNDVKNKDHITDIENRITDIENHIRNVDVIPDYWLEELETKAGAIRLAMETAGRNKSSFLWYTDSHWTYGNAKVSPILLKYLWKNTPMNKVNFGGDIVVNAQSRENMVYLYNEWRNAIRELPNHHSVVGNHDLMVDYPYTFLIAPEESADMVMGDGMYYYIDNPCEKTRYLYLDYLTSSETEAMTSQAAFILNALVSASDGWHIVVISHRWFQYTSTDAPTVGSIPSYYGDILRVFDAYNSRLNYSGTTYFSAQDFSNCGGKVEFCIGGHIHVDYDFTSNGGIPVIITASDVNQNRVPDSEVDSGTLGTITESAVFGIVADYNKNKITVVGVGRGTSREISY